ncbi:ATP-binding protein [Streptomyces sp. NPDC048290]|uniref:ATP-binding protein n=1 Tax=Streptomyces sp. NPDC048290 TaxID=3155811 RepID=UPI00342C2D89
MASPYLPHPPAQLPQSGLLRAVPSSRRPHDDAHHSAREHTRAPEPPGGEFAGQLPGDPCPDRLASGDRLAPAPRSTGEHGHGEQGHGQHGGHDTPGGHDPCQGRGRDEAPEEPGEHPARLSDAFTLPAVPASVGAARRRVRALLDAWHIAEDVQDDAVVVTSELVTNAVTHSASEYVVHRLSRSATLLRIEVEDQKRCSARPTPRDSAPDDQSGRGLLLVAAVSAEWGIDTAADGTRLVVWAELPTTLRTGTPAQTAPPEPATARRAAPAAAPALPGVPSASPSGGTGRPGHGDGTGHARRGAAHAAVPDSIETTTGPSPTRPKDVQHAPTPGH